jgi:hypothetical protein
MWQCGVMRFFVRDDLIARRVDYWDSQVSGSWPPWRDPGNRYPALRC